MYLWEDSASMAFLQQYLGINNFYPTPELVLFPINDSVLKIGYKMNIYATIPLLNNTIIIDANNSNTIYNEDRICSINGVADTRYSGTQTIKTKQSGNNYKLYTNDTDLKIYTLDMHNTGNYLSSTIFNDNDNNWTSLEYHNPNMDDAALDAHWGAEKNV